MRRFPAFPDRHEIDLHAVVKPARAVGGDFYDFYFIDEDCLCLVIGDVAGKGVPAALFMAVSKTLLKANSAGAASPAEMLTKVNEELCEESTELPTFYMDFPKEIAPLTKAHRDDPRFAEKWDLVCWGAEQGTAYSELNDPVDQRARFFAQSLLAAAGDLEAMAIDDDFLTELDYGMPPTGGQGMGIDRPVMTLTGLNIRETILFPMVKPQ